MDSSRISISNMTMLEYALAFAGERSALSDQYAQESARYSMMLSAKTDTAYSGYLCAVPDPDALRIAYVYVTPQCRGRGVAAALVQYVTERVRIPVKINIVAGHAYYDAVLSICRRLGFQKGESIRVFTCYAENYRYWEEFMERKGNRLCRYLEHQGYEAVRFTDADEDLLRQLRDSTKSGYANPLDPAPFLDVPERRLFREMSFAAVKDGTLMAYTLVRKVSPTKVIFEHISDSAEVRGTGCILLPFSEAMNAFGELHMETASYAMFGSNTHANAFREKLLTVLRPTCTLSENYWRFSEGVQTS